MKKIQIVDRTLSVKQDSFGFKDKLEIARLLDKIDVDVIEFPPIVNEKADTLLIRTASSFLKKSVVSVSGGMSEESIRLAGGALTQAKKPCIRIEVPVSPSGMEYQAHLKAAALPSMVEKLSAVAKSLVDQVEFCAIDAARADQAFLLSVLTAAISGGATRVTLCDSAGALLPADFATIVSKVKEEIGVPCGVMVRDTAGLACASSITAVQAGAEWIKTDAFGDSCRLQTVGAMLQTLGARYAFHSSLRQTELSRVADQIAWISGDDTAKPVSESVKSEENDLALTADATRKTVSDVVKKLGYDLSADDQKKVYDEFLRVAKKKEVRQKELDAIVASAALQVPSTYQLINYVINNGNIISASAQILLQKGEEKLHGICLGDGPIDAAFRAVDQIIGHRYELDDFQIQAVTEGKEAIGSALVKLRAGGKLYSGNGVSTDIIGASIRAYLGAVNKIIYEESSR